MKLHYLLWSAAVLCTPALLADDTRQMQLDEISVIGQQAQMQSDALRMVSCISQEQLASMPVQTLADVLNYLPGIDVRQRGSNGVQADLSMRGGTFDQVLVLLNGVNLTDAQTGHYSLDLPIDLSQVERIEVLQGTGMNLFGLSAFSGAINIITTPLASDSSKHEIHASLTGGENGLFSPSLSGKMQAEKWFAHASVTHSQSKGYMPNTDYQISNLYLQSGYNHPHLGKWQAQVGGQLKNYGANSFYSLKYPQQFEATKMLFSTLQWQKKLGAFSLNASGYWRTHYDRFELIRNMADAPAWYTGHNYHVTHTAGGNLQGSWHSRIGKTSAGLELRNEYIKSNVLGDSVSKPKPVPFGADTVFIFAKNRLNMNYFVEQAFFFGKFSASAGVSGNWNTLFGHNFCLGANIGYAFVNGGSLYANANRSLRLPTFTDLYYQSATQIANPNLKPEEALTGEIGIKWAGKGWHTQASAYYRAGRNLIDWVKLPTEEKWRSTNHTHVNGMGGEAVIGYQQGYWIKMAEVSYSFAHLDKDAGELLSKYALDYLRHKITLRVEHGIWKNFGAMWTLSYQDRYGAYTNAAGNTENYHPFWLLDGRIYWKNERMTLFAEGSNLTNRSYYDYGGIAQPGRWLKGGISVVL